LLDDAGVEHLQARSTTVNTVAAIDGFGNAIPASGHPRLSSAESAVSALSRARIVP
jgi:hypothetical protein